MVSLGGRRTIYTIGLLKFGNKYSSAYLNCLCDRIDQMLTLDHRFVCFTDKPRGVHRRVECRVLPEPGLQGWWNKVAFFKPGVLESGPVFYIDLDSDIRRNIDHLVTHVGKDPQCIYGTGHDPVSFGTQVLHFDPTRHHYIWECFCHDFDRISEANTRYGMKYSLQLEQRQHPSTVPVTVDVDLDKHDGGIGDSTVIKSLTWQMGTMNFLPIGEVENAPAMDVHSDASIVSVIGDDKSRPGMRWFHRVRDRVTAKLF